MTADLSSFHMACRRLQLATYLRTCQSTSYMSLAGIAQGMQQ